MRGQGRRVILTRDQEGRSEGLGSLEGNLGYRSMVPVLTFGISVVVTVLGGEKYYLVIANFFNGEVTL